MTTIGRDVLDHDIDLIDLALRAWARQDEQAPRAAVDRVLQQLRARSERPVSALEELSRRFAGVDLQRRREGCGPSAWWKPWRARLVTSKNERAEYRITVFGSTADEAVQALAAAVREIDEAPR